ncbi:MAG: GltB/FmdC/FwdC-like GXGXG domain-containing protein [Bacillota bacterium]
MINIDAKGQYYADLNKLVKQALTDGAQQITIKNVNGHRYIGDGIRGRQKITIEGVPGNDLAAYMDGLELIVKGNAQDGVANTMNDGTIIIHGDAGDTLGYAMRGGEVFVKGDVGYRVGIHMKEYRDKIPAIVIGGKAGDFLGEYMAGGILILLGLNVCEDSLVGNFCGTGMHGGVIFIRGQADEHQLGKEVKVVEMTVEDQRLLENYVRRFARYFAMDAGEILKAPFSKLIPFNKRPYGNLYAKY